LKQFYLLITIHIHIYICIIVVIFYYFFTLILPDECRGWSDVTKIWTRQPNKKRAPTKYFPEVYISLHTVAKIYSDIDIDIHVLLSVLICMLKYKKTKGQEVFVRSQTTRTEGTAPNLF